MRLREVKAHTCPRAYTKQKSRVNPMLKGPKGQKGWWIRYGVCSSPSGSRGLAPKWGEGVGLAGS